MQLKIHAIVSLVFAVGIFESPHQVMADMPAEMKALEGFVGTWQMEQTTKTADGREVKVTGLITTTRFVLGGRYLEYVTRTTSGERGSLGIIAYDEAQKKYRNWFFTAWGQHSEWSGTWDEKTRTLTRTRVKLQGGNTATGTSTFLDDDTIDFTIVGRGRDGKINVEMKSTSIRQPDAKPFVRKKSKERSASPPELKTLERMVGEWRDEGAMKASVWTPKEVRFKGESEKFWILDGKFVFSESKDAMFLWTYSANEKAVKMWNFNATGDIHEWTGKWDDDRNVLTLRSDLDGNPTVSSVLKQTFSGNDTITWNAIATDRAGKVYHHVEGTSKRRK